MMFKTQPTIEQLRNNFPAIFTEAAKASTSDKYLYIPTHKLIQGLESQGFTIAGAKTMGSRSADNKAFAKHVVYMTHENMKQVANVGEELPMLALTNSHNVLSSFAIDTAFFRLACSNGLLMPTTSLNSARVVHKIGMQDDVIQAARLVVEAFPEQVRMIEEMKRITLSVDEKYLLAETATNLAFDAEVIEVNKKVGVDIAAKMQYVRRSVDRSDDLWTSFNVIQENIIKGGHRIITENDKGERSRTKTRAVTSIDRDAKLNKELMSLAQKFAALKGAA